MPTYRETMDSIAAAGGTESQFEPQRPYNFRIVLPEDAVEGDNTHVAVESITIPNQTATPIELPYLNEMRKVAGPVTFENATMVIRDFVTPDVAEFFRGWWHKVYDHTTGGIGFARDYKYDMPLYMYGPTDDSESYRREWVLIGCWPTSFNLNELNMGTRGDIRKINMDLAVDRIKPGD